MSLEWYKSSAHALVLPANPSADGNGVRSPRHALQGMKLIRACDEEEDRFGGGYGA